MLFYQLRRTLMSEKPYVVYPMEWAYKNPSVQAIIKEYDTEEEAINYMKTTLTDKQFVLIKYQITDFGVHEGTGKLIALKSSESGEIIENLNS
jgi:hypothetical protein